MWKRASVRSLTKDISLLLCLSFIAVSRSAGQQGAESVLLLPQLLSCDKKPVIGPVHSITEKQPDPLHEKKMLTVAYMEFNEQGRIQMMEYKRHGVRTHYNYLPDGQLHSTVSYFKGAPLDSVVYAYRDDGKVRATLHYGPDGVTLQEVKQTHYDTTGMPVKVSARNVRRTMIEEVIGIDENYIVISWRVDSLPPQVFRYPFDPEHGCVISYDRRIEDATGERVMEIGEGPGWISIQEYEYDERGNWTACRYYNVKKGKKLRPKDMYLMRVREIEYR